VRSAQNVITHVRCFFRRNIFEPADAYHTFTCKGIKIGMSICEDIWDDAYTSKPTQMIRKKGAQLLVNISASPYYQQAPHRREQVIRNQAKKNELWIVYVNQVGGQDDLVFDGRSLVADPKGRLVACGKPFCEELLSIDIPTYHASLPPVTQSIDPIRDTYDALLMGIRITFKKNRFQRVVIGLSGGSIRL